MEKTFIIRPSSLYAFLKPVHNLIFGIIILSLGYFIVDALEIRFEVQTEYLDYLLFFCWVILLLFFFKYIYQVALINSQKYEISREKLNFKRGVFTIKTDFLELYRIKDFSEERPFLLRIINAMVVRLDTSDKSHAVFFMKGIPQSNITNVLRELVEENRLRKNVYEID